MRDGRTAGVYGGVATTPPDSGVDLYAGGTVGVLPSTGVVFQLVAPGGRVVNELCELPDAMFTAAAPRVQVVANGDQTRVFLLTGARLPSGFGRLRLRWLRDTDDDLPRLSVGGLAGAEDAVLRYRLR